MDIKKHSKTIALAIVVLAVSYYFSYHSSAQLISNGCNSAHPKKQGYPCCVATNTCPPCSDGSTPNGSWQYKDGSTQLYCKRY